MQEDAVSAGQKVLIIDDLLATGGEWDSWITIYTVLGSNWLDVIWFGWGNQIPNIKYLDSYFSYSHVTFFEYDYILFTQWQQIVHKWLILSDSFTF